MSSAIEMNYYQNQTDVPEGTLEERDTALISHIGKIEQVFQEKLTAIVPSTMKHWLKDFEGQSYPSNVLKVLSLPTYAMLTGLGALTSYASIDLLLKSHLSDALSPNIPVRVNFANTITNSGALFACLTDLPAITLVLYLFVFKNAYVEARREAWDASYHSLVGNLTVSPEMREELYLKHIAKLQQLGVEDYYLHPDPLSKTGALHEALAPALGQIDKQIAEEGTNMGAFLENCVAAFLQGSCEKKLVKVAGGAISLFSMAFASFLVFENIILVVDTPVSDLFSGSSDEQINEAFYLTQLGTLFSSLTAFGAAVGLGYFLFLRAPYRKTCADKIEACFAQHRPKDISMSDALYRIKEVKLRRYGGEIF